MTSEISRTPPAVSEINITVENFITLTLVRIENWIEALGWPRLQTPTQCLEGASRTCLRNYQQVVQYTGLRVRTIEKNCSVVSEHNHLVPPERTTEKWMNQKYNRTSAKGSPHHYVSSGFNHRERIGPPLETIYPAALLSFAGTLLSDSICEPARPISE